MPQVTIGSTAYDVYADVSEALAYLGGSISSAAEAYRTADSDTQSRALVSATRWIDEQSWQGEKTDPSQALAWPRSGIDGVDGATVPDAIVSASIELAALLASDADFRATMREVALKSLKAGSVALEYFRGATVQVDTAFPSNVMLLIGQWLAGSESALGGAITFGTCRETKLDEGYDFYRGIF